MPKTILGALIAALGWIGQSGVLGAEYTPLLHSISELLVAIGGVIAAVGIWHGQAKIQAAALRQNVPNTVSDALAQRRVGLIK